LAVKLGSIFTVKEKGMCLLPEEKIV